MQQHTLKSPLTFTGKTLHSGIEATLRLLPAPPDTGYRIRRTDLQHNPEVPAFAEMVDFTDRCTRLSSSLFSVATIEHALSALYAVGVDNCILEIDGPEFPILTGNAIPYTKAIEEVGLEAQLQDREYYYVRKTQEVVDEETGARILICPDEKFSVEVHLSYDTTPPGKQCYIYTEESNYVTEIAPARSYVLVSEVLGLLAKDMVKGGDFSNALIIKDRELTPEETSLLQQYLPNQELSEGFGFINASKSLGENEPARHKVLDFLGDLALTGSFIKGRFLAFMPGHGINNKAARLLRNEIKLTESREPYYDPNAEPILSLSDIRRLLPHRYPFLLVDKVIEMGHNSIVGVKNVSGNEPFFVGHFPNEPVMPGVLIVEAMAQTGGLLVINALHDEGKWSTYLLKIDKVKFRRKVVPGDTLFFRLRLISEIRRGIAMMRGVAFVGSTVVCEAEFTAQIVKDS